MSTDQDRMREKFMSEWRDYQMLVLSQMEELKRDFKDIKGSIEAINSRHYIESTQNKIEINQLKSRSSFWGSVGGTLSVLVYLFFEWISHRIKN